MYHLWRHDRRVKRLLVIVIQQHGDQGEFSDVFGQFAGKGDEALAAFGLELIPVAQAGFEQRGQPLGDDGFHIFIGGQGTFFQFDAEPFADPVEGKLFRAADEGDCYAGSPRPSGTPCPVDVRFQLIGRFVLDDVGEFGDVQTPRGYVGRDEEP